jgi:hypothetical protein
LSLKLEEADASLFRTHGDLLDAGIGLQAGLRVEHLIRQRFVGHSRGSES